MGRYEKAVVLFREHLLQQRRQKAMQRELVLRKRRLEVRCGRQCGACVFIVITNLPPFCPMQSTYPPIEPLYPYLIPISTSYFPIYI